MKYIINAILAVIIIFLIFVLIKSIEEPIGFQEEYSKRKKAVVSKLEDIREAQLAFRSVKKGYSPTYDSLRQVISTDSFELVSIIGDADAGDNIVRKVTMVSMKDSLVGSLGINLDSLEFIPFTDGQMFELSADTVTYQSTLVPVVQVSVPIKSFMAEFSGEDVLERFQRYDPNFDPEEKLQFGNMRKPTTSGNWE